MKRILLVISILCCTLSASASFKDLQWTIFGEDCDGVMCYDVKVQGDTIVNGKTYYYIPGAHTLSNDKMAFGGYLREYGRQVYVLNETTGEDLLLYDYSLQKGDSMAILYAIRDSETKWSYKPTEDMSGEIKYYHVIDTDMVTLANGEQRKRMRLDAGWTMIDVIEGIGSTKGIWGGICYWPQSTCSHWASLLCCSDGKQNLYHTDLSIYATLPNHEIFKCGCEVTPHKSVTHANIWTLNEYGSENPEEQCWFNSYSITKDTIIDDVTYYVLSGYLFRYNEESNRIYCRLTDEIMKRTEDSTNIQAHKEGADMLFLDYNANAGDTVYTLALPEGWVCKNIVKSVTEIDGRRWIEVEFIVFDREESRTDDKYANDYWIEGIGRKAGLTCYSRGHAGSHFSNIFCASHDDELLYRESEEKAKSIYKEYGIISPCHEDVIDAVENVSENATAKKVLIDGQLYIIRNEEIFTITGQNVK